MKRVLASLTLGAALMGTPAAAQAQDPVSEMDRKDMECFAVFASMAGQDPELVLVGSVGMAYFIGRLEGRNPGVNQLERLSRWMYSQDEAALDITLHEADARCAAELDAFGRSLVAVGNAGA